MPTRQPSDDIYARAFEAGRMDPLGGSYQAFLESLKLPQGDPRAKELEPYYYGAAIAQGQADFDEAVKDPAVMEGVIDEGREMFAEKYGQWDRPETKALIDAMIKQRGLLPYDQTRKDAYWNTYHDEMLARYINPFD